MSAKANEHYAQFVKEMVDPEMTLDLVASRTRLMILKQTPKRIQVADDAIAAYNLMAPTQISLLGRNVGVTVLTLWFADPASGKDEILTYQVRVLPDPELKARMDQIYRALADEINQTFPDSNVGLQLVGDKLVVTGNAKDIQESTEILRIVRANAPSHGLPNGKLAHVPVNPTQAGQAGPVVGPDGRVVPGIDAYAEIEGYPQVINLLRVHGEQQVMLRVTVAEVNRAAARSIGLDFNIKNDRGMAIFANNTGSIATGGLAGAGGLGIQGAFSGSANGFGGVPGIAGVAVGAGGFNNLPAALDNGEVGLAISALRNLNYARSLAEPNLVTMNGQTATFQAGGQFPVPFVTGYTAAGLQGVNFIPFGVQLSFTPFITDRDRVRLVMAAEVSSRDLAAGSTLIGGSAVPNLTTRNFQTTVELREGQTLAVAGLIQNNIGADATRVPFFGDLPIIGRLAAFDRTSAGEQELVVLVTPVLVHPLEDKELPPLPGSDLFEPDDLEFYLLGRLESHHCADYRSPVRTDFDRQCRDRKYEQMYISGPHGHDEHH